MHAANVAKSARLQRVLEALRVHPDGLTTWEITEETGTLAVSATVAELRQNLAPLGQDVRCEYVSRTRHGARIYRYTLEGAA